MFFKLHITSNIWTKESNSLFDYESSDLIKSSICIKSNGILQKNDKKLYFSTYKNSKENGSLYQNLNFLASIKLSDDVALLNLNNNKKNLNLNGAPGDLTEKPWLIARHSYSKNDIGFKLHEGDIIKLGKIVFKVKEIVVRQDKRNSKDKQKDRTLIEHLKDNNGENGNYDHSDNFRNQFNMNILNQTNQNNQLRNQHTNDLTSKPSEIRMFDNGENIEKLIMKENRRRKKNPINQPMCRICLCEDNDETNPLINPCKCSGTMKYIHLNCLQQCLKSKITTKVFNFLIIHLIRNIECELCKQPLKERFRIKGQIINSLEIQRPENNYLILEGVNKEKSENKYLYVIHMKDKQIIKMGRSNDADVRITDISVSRSHAFLKLYEGTFYIEDNHSKFGTLIQIPENFLVFPNRQLSLQLGRTFVIFSMRKTCMALLRCYKSDKNVLNDYNDLIQELRSERKDDVQDIVTPTIEKYSSYEDSYNKSEENERKMGNTDENEIDKTQKSFGFVSKNTHSKNIISNNFMKDEFNQFDNMNNELNRETIKVDHDESFKNLNNVNYGEFVKLDVIMNKSKKSKNLSQKSLFQEDLSYNILKNPNQIPVDKKNTPEKPENRYQIRSEILKKREKILHPIDFFESEINQSTLNKKEQLNEIKNLQLDKKIDVFNRSNSNQPIGYKKSIFSKSFLDYKEVSKIEENSLNFLENNIIKLNNSHCDNQENISIVDKWNENKKIE